MLKPCGPLTGG